MPPAPPDPAERTDERPRPARRRPTRQPDPPPGEPDDGGLTSLELQLITVLREGQTSLIGELKAIRTDVRVAGIFAGVLVVVLVVALAMLRGLDPRALGDGASQILRAVPGASLLLPAAPPAASSALPAPLDSGGAATADAPGDSPAP